MTSEEYRRKYTNTGKSAQRHHKYGAKRVSDDGAVFDSEKEYRRWQELVLLQRAGVISDLQRQVSYELVPEQREPDTVGPRDGEKNGKLHERPVTYKADFVYTKDGETVVEDTKGYRTPEYIIKRKLMLYVHGIRIREI